MKRTMLTTLTIGLLTTSIGIADIQEPIFQRFGRTRKLGRAISNITMGLTEIPVQMANVQHNDGDTAAFSYGLTLGIKKAAVRIGYGFFELVTWGAPNYRQSYRAPYGHRVEMEPFYGYTEFPPQLGWTGEAKYNRSQAY